MYYVFVRTGYFYVEYKNEQEDVSTRTKPSRGCSLQTSGVHLTRTDLSVGDVVPTRINVIRALVRNWIYRHEYINFFRIWEHEKPHHM